MKDRSDEPSHHERRLYNGHLNWMLKRPESGTSILNNEQYSLFERSYPVTVETE